MVKIQDGKLLYHLTKLSNLDSIIKNGLISRKTLLEKGTTFDDVANSEIISKRTMLKLDEYVPFHFHPYSSFDVAVKKKYKDDDFIYICIYRETAKKNGFKIIPKHPLNESELKLYSYEEGFNQIDWDAMGKSSSENSHVREVKMAECITNKAIHVSLFANISVKNEDIKKIVEDKLKNYGIFNPPYINIQPWLNIDN